jgi:tetratricopeptide (TPR) repeat protein
MFNKACGYIRDGKVEKASKILKKLVSNNPGWYDAVYNLGVAYFLQGRKQKAISAFLDVIKINPGYIQAYNNVCIALVQENEFEKAIEYGQKGLSIDPSHVNICRSLASALGQLGRYDEAIVYLRKSLSIKDDDIAVLKALGSALYRTGQKEEAEEVDLKYLQLKPDDVIMHRNLSMLRKYTAGDEHLMQMEKLLEVAPEKADLHFAIGKAYEDIGDYQKSFTHYEAGNTLRRASVIYSPDLEKEFFQQIRQVFTKDFIESNKLSERDKTPIFIVGMPRSSTSLIEQILASHPKIYGAGELNYLDDIQLNEMKINRNDYAESIGKMKPGNFKKMADLYVKKLGNVWEEHDYVIDKMPQNFLYLGLIKTLFPGSKIIHCIREPRDTCFSIFKTYFRTEMLFAHSQKDIVAYYKLYEELMVYWHSVFPEASIYDIQYETLIENPEESIRALLAHCDLEWHDACIEFHKTKREVKTASAFQVRKPLYKGAAGYWKNYEPYLDEIVRNFEV